MNLNNLNSLNITENTLANIFAAILIALFVYFASTVRNWLLERDLRNAIDPNGIGIEFNKNPLSAKFSIQIHNYANATIRVRSVVLICDKFHIELLPTKQLHQTPLINEVVRPSFDRKSLSKEFITQDTNPDAVVLPPKTMSFWFVGTDMIASRDWVAKKMYVVFEYSTIFGNVAMIRVEVTGQSLNAIKEQFDSLVHNVRDSITGA